MRVIKFIIILSFFAFRNYGQNQKDISVVDGKFLTNLKAADVTKYYKYPIDSVNYTLLKFNKNGEVVNYVLHNESHEKLVLDSVYGKNYRFIFLKNEKGQKFNILDISKKDPLYLSIYAHQLDTNLRTISYGYYYSYYKNKRLSAIMKYNEFGVQEWDMVKYDGHGYRAVEQIAKNKIDKILVFNKKGTSNLYVENINNGYKILEKHYKNGIVSTLDTLNIDGIITGTHLAFYDTGVIKEKSIYKNGKRNGKCILYNSNGVIIKEEDIFER